MKSNVLTVVSVAVAVSVCRGAVVVPTVSNVMVSSGNSGKVTVTYDLLDANGIVTCDFLTNGVSVGLQNATNLVGDVNKVVAVGNSKNIVWRPYEFWPDGVKIGVVSNVSVKVTAWPEKSPPDYMVVDLAEQSNSRIEYYQCAAAVPGGVTNNIYKTTKMVFRKIPAANATFRMGSPTIEIGRGKGASDAKWMIGGESPHLVSFTNDFYIGIYEVTHEQWKTVTGSYTPASFVATDGSILSPVVNVGRHHITGVYTSDVSAGNRFTYDWHSSFVGYFIRRTGLAYVTLPTDAEWEFACRAGEDAAFYWGGEAVTNESGVCEGLGDYAWYDANSDGMAHPVGLKRPNAWGLYDMSGNVSETTLDLVKETWLVNASGKLDPFMDYAEAGYQTFNGANLTRGGSWWGPAAECRSASRTAPNATWGFVGAPNGGAHIGFRLAMRLFQ